jgi:hypothetical protein
MSVWQVAAGSGSEGRDYADRFLRYGMAFFGGENHCLTLDGSVQLDDKIILKRGMSQIVAVGRVVTRDGKLRETPTKTATKDGCATLMVGIYPHGAMWTGTNPANQFKPTA